MDDDYTETYTGPWIVPIDYEGCDLTWPASVVSVESKLGLVDALKEITQHLDAIAEVLHRLTEGEP